MTSALQSRQGVGRDRPSNDPLLLKLLGVTLWVFGVDSGLFLLTSFANTPGAARTIDARCPGQTSLQTQASRARAVVWNDRSATLTSSSLVSRLSFSDPVIRLKGAICLN